jgi:hypothetical protein
MDAIFPGCEHSMVFLACSCNDGIYSLNLSFFSFFFILSTQRHYRRLILLLILLHVSGVRPSSGRKYIIS